MASSIDRRNFSHLVAVLLATVLVASARPTGDNPPHEADPFADPRNDPYNPLRYIASNTLTLIAFELISWTAIFQGACMWKWRTWWMSTLVVGELTFSFGIACRWALHKNPDSRGWYIAEYLFVILSPCAFIAADYIILGRLVRFLKCEKHLRIVPPRKITTVFLSSDITTFLIQAAGGGVATGTSVKSATTGTHIFLAGLIIQLISFLIYTSILLSFLYNVHKFEPEIWRKDAGKRWFSDWRALAGALVVSCIGIIIRSIYRTAEMSQGFRGALATNEALFYGLDTLPLFLAVVIYLPFWPGRFIQVPAEPQPEAVDDEQKPPETVRPSSGEEKQATAGQNAVAVESI
ncbi:RTA1-domain-containing protein [Dentipellis sp. KUC8613]|nr:RTA1-domain-containing protein [Dentipellis sp. KUC8613]